MRPIKTRPDTSRFIAAYRSLSKQLAEVNEVFVPLKIIENRAQNLVPEITVQRNQCTVASHVIRKFSPFPVMYIDTSSISSGDIRSLK